MPDSSFHSLPAIIDVEASGLHIDSYPVEIAVLAGGAVSSWLIVPESGWRYWDPVAEEMHGITRKMLRDQGTRATKVARELNAVVRAQGSVVYSDAAPWDRDWIRILYITTGISCEFQVLPLQGLLDDTQHQRFDNHRRELEGSGRYRVHRAGEDVKLILEAYGRAVG
jgi:hypothetical protein